MKESVDTSNLHIFTKLHLTISYLCLGVRYEMSRVLEKKSTMECQKTLGARSVASMKNLRLRVTHKKLKVKFTMYYLMLPDLEATFKVSWSCYQG